MEKKIEKYYLERLKKYSDELNKAIVTILGEQFQKLLTKKKDLFHLIFTASREGLEYHLNNTPDKEEKEVIEFLLDKLEQENREFVIISSIPTNMLNNEKFNDWLQSQNTHRSIADLRSQLINGYKKIDIFEPNRDGILQDAKYIYGLLTHLVLDLIIDSRSFYEPEFAFSIPCDIKNANEEIYFRILNTITIQIVALLRHKNIYLLDNANDYNEEIMLGYKIVDPKFIAAFQNLLPLFLVEPDKFIEIVGVNNFRDFTLYTLDPDSQLDIDQIINKMKQERAKKIYYEIILLNLPLIHRGKQKLDQDKSDKTDHPTLSKSVPTHTISGGQIGKSRLLLENVKEIINNIYNDNILNDDDWKFNNDLENNDDWKFRNPDDFSPRKR